MVFLFLCTVLVRPFMVLVSFSQSIVTNNTGEKKKIMVSFYFDSLKKKQIPLTQFK